jgi:hypothetical protein
MNQDSGRKHIGKNWAIESSLRKILHGRIALTDKHPTFHWTFQSKYLHIWDNTFKYPASSPKLLLLSETYRCKPNFATPLLSKKPGITSHELQTKLKTIQYVEYV